MAITENAFTLDEIKVAIEANPTLKDVLVEGVKTVSGMKVFTDQDLTAHETNLRSGFTKTIAEKTEAKLKEYGIEKASADEKWYGLYERGVKTYKDKSDALEVKVKDFEGKTDLSASERERLTRLETELEASKKTLSQKESEFTSTLSKKEIENEVYRSFSGVEAKFKKDELLQDAIVIVKEKAAKEVVALCVKDGDKIVLKGSDGKFMFDKDGTTLLTPEKFYEQKMEKFIDNGRQQGGAGGGAPKGGGPNISGNFKTQLEVNSYLRSQGLISGTKEFTEALEKLNYSKLPIM